LYETVAKRVVRASLDGYNGTIFAYGQTGSGKTYTMMGSEGADHEPINKIVRKERRSVSPFRTLKSFPKENPSPRHQKFELPKEKGIIIYALEDLFESVSISSEKNYYLMCSYLEIYNEQVYDLISEGSSFKNEVLSVNEDPQRGFYVKGLSEHVVGSIDEVLNFIEKGEANRKYAVTSMNHNSSRSHTIFRLNVTSVRVVDSQDEEDSSITTESVLNFVDLAGSERVSNLQDTPLPRPRMKSSNNLETLIAEGKHINTSLFYLCQVINRLSEKNTSKNDMHIPYRNSNLTKILRSSLGGNSLTCIICTATPTLAQFEMTLSTLRFGGTARTITNRVEANIRNNKNAEILQAYQRDIDVLRNQIQIAQENGKLRAEETLAMKKQLEDRILKLTHMVLNKGSREKTGYVYSDVWSIVSGILNIDERLIDPPVIEKLENKNLKFDSKGVLAIERMKSMNGIFKEKDKTIQTLTQTKQFLIDSKVNVKYI
jgi:Kinesin motor domain